MGKLGRQAQVDDVRRSMAQMQERFKHTEQLAQIDVLALISSRAQIAETLGALCLSRLGTGGARGSQSAS